MILVNHGRARICKEALFIIKTFPVYAKKEIFVSKKRVKVPSCLIIIIVVRSTIWTLTSPWDINDERCYNTWQNVAQ